MVDFSLQDVKHWAGPHTFAKGVDYYNRNLVRSVRIVSDDLIQGTVKGTGNEPYTVEVRVGRRKGAFTAMGQCSCPVGMDCKHVVAVLTFVAKEPRQDDLTPEQINLGPGLRAWLAELDTDPETVNEYPPEVRLRMVYLLTAGAGVLRLSVASCPVLENGEPDLSRTKPFPIGDFHRSNPAKYLRPNDLDILKEVTRAAGYYFGKNASFEVHREDGKRIFNKVLSTGRAFWLQSKSPVTVGPVRCGRGSWKIDKEGVQSFAFEVEGGGTPVLLDAVWYADEARSMLGPLDVGLPTNVAAALLTAPRTTADQSLALRLEMEHRFPDRPDLWPTAIDEPEILDVAPSVHLKLTRQNAAQERDYSRKKPLTPVLIGSLTFKYGSKIFKGSEMEVQFFEQGRMAVIRRRVEDEERAFRTLMSLGMKPLKEMESVGLNYYGLDASFDNLALAGLEDGAPSLLPLFQFLSDAVPKLRELGWKVDLPNTMPPPVYPDEGEWEAEITPAGSGIDWFNLSLGIKVDGKPVDLMPTLLKLLSSNSRADIEQTPDDKIIFAQVDDIRTLALPAWRLKPIIRGLFELYDGAPNDEAKLPRSGSAALAELEAADLKWRSGEDLLQLAKRLRDFRGISLVQPPKEFKGQMRPYQMEGLSWLQFLREYDFGGVLADDMGLGKTVQTLAHVLKEKVEGRLVAPCLVVAPTSLMANWRLEAARFAPDLKVLTLHGADRRTLFSQISFADLVLTTYPLLSRDKDFLLKQQFHLVVLDEAQNIKNPKTTAALVSGQLEARHRLCLTGTPIENHLGELWSIFNFLSPGLLGSEAKFKSTYRNPIERDGDEERQKLLSKRLAPFMLRRTKDEVVRELPPKTEILEHVELEGAQRDLYEEIRLAMHEKVRRALKDKGVARSHIVVLDALLKLRQVCCDPRLLSMDSAKTIKESAKLQMLMQMLPEMIAGGRRVLLFSQFTSMLALIEAEVQRLGISYALLTGSTVKRAEEIEKFQSGSVPLFLISLKAGGTGLNLTAADTVIHYDPWWNPAVDTVLICQCLLN